MVFVKCQVCGNVYGCPPRSFGGTCGVNGCSGVLSPHESVSPASNPRVGERRLLLQCPECGNVYSSPPRRIWERCAVNGCMGLLDRR